MQRIALAMAVVLLSSCYDYDADEFDQSNPKKEDLVGTYKLASQSLTRDGNLNIFGDAPCEVVLHPDGTFEGISVPPSNPAIETEAEFHSVDFIKKLVRESGKWNRLEGQHIIEFSSADGLHFFFDASLIKPTPKSDRGILIIIGDEDSGNTLYLERISKR